MVTEPRIVSRKWFYLLIIDININFLVDILNSFWTRVIVEPLGSEELSVVLRHRFSPIEPLIGKVIGKQQAL